MQNCISNLHTALQNCFNVSQALHQLFCAIWLTKWNKTSGNPVPCPTERLLILITLNKDGGHQEPKDVTGYLAKFQFCIRLACLKEIKRLAPIQFHDNEEDACNSLLQWFTEKTHSPFSRIRALQHYASSISFQTMSMPCIWWLDRMEWKELLYKGEKIHLDQLQAMFSTSGQTIIDIWEKKVLKGTNLQLSYDHLADTMGNNEVGYSFLTDPRNTCFNNHDALANAFMANPSIRDFFGHFHAGKMTWNYGALMQWLRDYAEFQAHLLMRCEMLSGAPGRGTELTPMLYSNTKHRSQRNLVIMGKHVAILRRYNKMGSMTGQDKLIPHSLDAITGDLMIQSLALARPFAELVIHLCQPQRQDILCLYQSHIFVNVDRLFDTNDLSNIMARTSLNYVNCKLTVNPWRHISIAFKRKLAHYTEELLDLDEADTADILQAGHSRMTENRVYGLSPDALAGAAEDVLPHFLHASVKWQHIMHTVPGGLGLSYKCADPPQFLHLAKSGQLGIDVQKEVLGHLQPKQHILSEEKVADQVVAKIEERLLNNLEKHFIDKVSTAIVPIVLSALKEAMGSDSMQQSMHRFTNAEGHTSKDPIPRDGAQWTSNNQTNLDSTVSGAMFCRLKNLDNVQHTISSTVTQHRPTNLEDMEMEDLYDNTAINGIQEAIGQSLSKGNLE